MGCAASRFDKRTKFSRDMNTVGLNFIESYMQDGCPADKYILNENYEITDYKIKGLKATDRKLIAKVYLETHESIS